MPWLLENHDPALLAMGGYCRQAIAGRIQAAPI